MPRSPDHGKGDARYFLRFAGTAALLVAGTLVLVLYVLPQRYVLSSGFREGSLVLPDPSTPFEPLGARRIAALPLPVRDVSTAPDGVGRGPAELFWARVVPLIEAERWPEAISLFASYLAEWPGDGDVRREYALTLHAAGYGDRAVPVLERLLATDDDPAIRLVLARVLRDIGRVDEADVHYARRLAGDPSDEGLWLERAQALAWAESYDRAEDVLLAGLEVHPASVPLRVELARVWYATDRLAEARDLLAAIAEHDLAAAGASTLRNDIVAALTPPPGPEAEPVPVPTTLERAIVARTEGRLDEAEALFEAALRDAPEDPDVWRAWADFLQYEREDFPEALIALKEVEQRTGGGAAALQYRMAQLEVWTDDTAAARIRLESRLVSDPAFRADALALLAHLARWAGDRPAAARRYEAALAEEPGHPGATEGMASLRADLERVLIQSERPRVGAIAESFSDTDDFTRADLGGEWTGLRESWVWGTRTGGRYVRGLDVGGADASDQGVFAELEGGRWWRWGTVRTALHGSAQTIRAGEVDLGVGASLRLVGEAGRTTDVRYELGPAFEVANTFQAVQSNVRQHRFSAAHTEPLGPRWIGAVALEGAALDHVSVAASAGNTRLQGSLAVGRVVRPSLTVGLATRALHWTDPAPAPGGLRLYWDPELSLSVGPYLQYRRPISTWWEMSARLNPGVTWIDERSASGGELVPDLTARLGVVREGARFRTSIEAFYGQGRFTGYRSYGLDLSFSARRGTGR